MYLRRDIVWSSTHGARLAVAQNTRQAEVSYLDDHVKGEKHVAQLEIAVEEASLVDVPGAQQDLLHVVPGLWLSYGAAIL